MKALVTYFSASGVTGIVAKRLADADVKTEVKGAKRFGSGASAEELGAWAKQYIG